MEKYQIRPASFTDWEWGLIVEVSGLPETYINKKGEEKPTTDNMYQRAALSRLAANVGQSTKAAKKIREIFTSLETVGDAFPVINRGGVRPGGFEPGNTLQSKPKKGRKK